MNPLATLGPGGRSAHALLERRAARHPVGSILLVRLSAIGDIVMASALLPVLRATYPQAHIAWLTEPETRGILEGNPLLDEVIAWPKTQWGLLWRQRRWGTLWSELRGFRRELRERHFDLVLDVQGLLKSGALAYLSGARLRIGLDSREGSGWLMSRTLGPPPASRRIGSEYLYLAQELGWEPGEFAMSLALPAEDRQFAEDFIEEEKLHGGYAVLCPFTTRPQKHWVEERWAELAGRLLAGMALRVVMLGGPNDRLESRTIHGLGQGKLTNAVGRTSLSQSAALIERAALLVGVDTGLTHMGIALRRPTVALFGSTVPYQDPASTQAVVLYHPMSCSPCRRHPTCHGAYTCMRSIGVEEVLAAARSVLSGRPAPA